MGAKYIGAAQPATILDLIAEIEALEKEADWLADTLVRCDDRFHMTGFPPKTALYFRDAARKAIS